MTKIRHTVQPDKNIIEALKKISSPVYDKKHHLYVFFNDDLVKKGETRFEHIAKEYHELKVRDIECVEKGINNYLSFKKSKEINDSYNYYVKRKGKDRGFIQISILVDIEDKTKAYVKTIFIAYRIK